MGVQDDVISIVRAWANLDSDPVGSDVLEELWSRKHTGPFADAAQDLASRIKSKFGTNIPGSDINQPGGGIKTVDDLEGEV